MSRRKKNFPCGHKGYRSICHRCAQEQKNWEQKKQQKNAWEETFAKDPIDLTKMSCISPYLKILSKYPHFR